MTRHKTNIQTAPLTSVALKAQPPLHAVRLRLAFKFKTFGRILVNHRGQPARFHSAERSLWAWITRADDDDDGDANQCTKRGRVG